MIFFSGFEIIKSSLHIFMQGVPEGVDFDKVREDICSFEGVKSAHKIHIWSINSNEIFLSAHILVDSGKINNTNKLISDINSRLHDSYHIEHSSLQVENKMLCGEDELCN